MIEVGKRKSMWESTVKMPAPPRAKLLLTLGFVLAAALGAFGAEAKKAAPSKKDADEKLNALLDRVEQKRKKLKTLQAEIEQVKHIEALEAEEKASGAIKFRMPRLLRIELTGKANGRKRIFVVGKEYAWLYKPHFQQVERFRLRKVDKSKKCANPFEFGLGSDLREMKDLFDIRLLDAEKVKGRPAQKIELVPNKQHKDKSPHSKIVIWIDDAILLPVKVKQHKSDGEIIETYTLSKVKVNPTFWLNPFKFKPPRGVDVFDHEELKGP